MIATLALFASLGGIAQVDTVLLNAHPLVQLSPPSSVLSGDLERNGAPYFYGACMELGLVTFDISDPEAVVPVDTVPTSAFGGAPISSITQVGQRLFVPLGGPFDAAGPAGLAILDVGTPADPQPIGLWDSTAWMHGAAIVRVNEQVAFVGAMDDGVIALDVADPHHIHFLSQLLPDPTWPGINSDAPHARGMDILADTLYLAFDGGGLRAIDIHDPQHMTEIGRYRNPQQPPFTPIAYNNVRVVNGLAFVAADFCGLEVVDVHDAANMQQLAWLDPWHCLGFSWFGSDGHTNELATALGDSLLLMSGGDSELLIYDITQPAQPRLAGGFIHPNDSAATWGLDVRDQQVAIGYVYNAGLPFQPYYSNVGGFQLFDWSAVFPLALQEYARIPTIRIAPDPSSGPIEVEVRPFRTGLHLVLTDAIGRTVMQRALSAEHTSMDLSTLGRGLLLASLLDADGRLVATQRLVLD